MTPIVSKDMVQYRVLAKYFGAQSRRKDYGKETCALVERVGRYERTSGKDLLEVGCATGKHIVYVAADLGCVGLESRFCPPTGREG